MSILEDDTDELAVANWIASSAAFTTAVQNTNTSIVRALNGLSKATRNAYAIKKAIAKVKTAMQPVLLEGLMMLSIARAMDGNSGMTGNTGCGLQLVVAIWEIWENLSWLGSERKTLSVKSSLRRQCAAQLSDGIPTKTSRRRRRMSISS